MFQNQDKDDEKNKEEEDKCPEGFEFNSILNVCDDVDEVNLFVPDIKVSPKGSKI